MVAKSIAHELAIAAYKGRTTVVKQIVDSNEKVVNAITTLAGRTGTALFHSCRTGKIEVIDFLISVGADKDLHAEHEHTPIHVAALQNHLYAVQLLAEHGAEIDKTSEGAGYQTALHIAAQCAYIEIVGCLIKYGADVFVKNAEGQLPLDSARNEETRRIIEEEQDRRNDNHGFKRGKSSQQSSQPSSPSSSSSSNHDSSISSNNSSDNGR